LHFSHKYNATVKIKPDYFGYFTGIKYLYKPIVKVGVDPVGGERWYCFHQGSEGGGNVLKWTPHVWAWADSGGRTTAGWGVCEDGEVCGGGVREEKRVIWTYLRL